MNKMVISVDRLRRRLLSVLHGVDKESLSGPSPLEPIFRFIEHDRPPVSRLNLRRKVDTVMFRIFLEKHRSVGSMDFGIAPPQRA